MRPVKIDFESLQKLAEVLKRYEPASEAERYRRIRIADKWGRVYITNRIAERPFLVYYLILPTGKKLIILEEQ